MFEDFDPRDADSRDRQDGIHEREDERLVLGRGPGAPEARDDGMEHEPCDRDEDWPDERDRDPRDRDDEHGGLDPRNVFMRDVDVPDALSGSWSMTATKA